MKIQCLYYFYRNREPELDENLEVRFLKNGQPMNCGDTFKNSDQISVDYELPGQHLIDVTGAIFANGNIPNCPNRITFSIDGNTSSA